MDKADPLATSDSILFIFPSSSLHLWSATLFTLISNGKKSYKVSNIWFTSPNIILLDSVNLLLYLLIIYTSTKLGYHGN